MFPGPQALHCTVMLEPFSKITRTILLNFHHRKVGLADNMASLLDVVRWLADTWYKVQTREQVKNNLHTAQLMRPSWMRQLLKSHPTLESVALNLCQSPIEFHNPALNLALDSVDLGQHTDRDRNQLRHLRDEGCCLLFVRVSTKKHSSPSSYDEFLKGVSDDNLKSPKSSNPMIIITQQTLTLKSMSEARALKQLLQMISLHSSIMWVELSWMSTTQAVNGPTDCIWVCRGSPEAKC